MSDLQIKQFDPLKKAYSKRIDESEWLQFESIIRGAHSSRLTRKEMLNMLRESYGFTPSAGQLQTRLIDWGLTVYNMNNDSRPAFPIDVMESSEHQDDAFTSEMILYDLMTLAEEDSGYNETLSASPQKQSEYLTAKDEISQDAASSLTDPIEISEIHPQPTERMQGLVSTAKDMPNIVVIRPASPRFDRQSIVSLGAISWSTSSSLRTFRNLARRLKRARNPSQTSEPINDLKSVVRERVNENAALSYEREVAPTNDVLCFEITARHFIEAGFSFRWTDDLDMHIMFGNDRKIYVCRPEFNSCARDSITQSSLLEPQLSEVNKTLQLLFPTASSASSSIMDEKLTLDYEWYNEWHDLNDVAAEESFWYQPSKYLSPQDFPSYYERLEALHKRYHHERLGVLHKHYWDKHPS